MRKLSIVALLWVSACGPSNAWDMKGAPKVSPDEQYLTGTETRDYYWVWHCHENERIAISQHATAMWGAAAPKMFKGACGQPLPVEVAAAALRPRPTSSGMRWPGSPPPPAEAGDAAAP